MPVMKPMTLAFALPLALAASAHAQPQPQSQPEPPVTVSMVAPPADPARLAEARRTIDYIFPKGTYRRLMGGNFTKMMGGVSDVLLDMPVRDIVTMGGMPAEEADKIAEGVSMRDVLAIVDPAYPERNRIMFDSMMAGMADVMDGFEPDVRDALVTAYAGKFTAAQLAEMNRFFATPTGTLYARNAMSLSMDPAFMDKMMKLTPRLLDVMPRIAQTAAARTKALPPRRTWASLSQAEKDRLTTMLGVSVGDSERAVTALEKQQQQRKSTSGVASDGTQPPSP